MNDLLLALPRFLHIAASFAFAGTTLMAATLVRDTNLTRLAWWFFGAATLSAAAWFIAQTADFAAATSLSDIVAALPIVAQNTRFGTLLLARCAALLLAALLLQCRLPRPAALLAFGAVAAESWLGHGGSMEGQTGTLLLITSIAHLTAAAAWAGSLPALYLALKTTETPRTLAARFSPLGIACVATLLATAYIQYVILIAHPAAFFTTAYGAIALLKLLLLAALITLAARNRRLTPTLPATRPTLLRNIAAEIALGLLILLAAALLLQLEPPTMLTMPR
jgi:putative copper resistance protein D